VLLSEVFGSGRVVDYSYFVDWIQGLVDCRLGWIGSKKIDQRSTLDPEIIKRSEIIINIEFFA